MHVDTYGNLITNLPSCTAYRARFVCDLRQRRHPDARRHYAAVEPGALLALVGSAGLLEISARDASAAAITGRCAAEHARASLDPEPSVLAAGNGGTMLSSSPDFRLVSRPF